MSESTPEDRAEQETTPTGDRPATRTPDVPLEAPAADVTEQEAPAAADDAAAGSDSAADPPLEADPADAAEQAAVVDLDDDERR